MLGTLIKEKSKPASSKILEDLGLPLQTPRDVEELEKNLTQANEKALVKNNLSYLPF